VTSTWTIQDIPDQSGRSVVVTGANAGLGYETALTLGAAGATVILACRNLAKAERAVSQMRRLTPTANLLVYPLDLADLTSVRGFVDRVGSEHDQLDLLINNAGLMAVDESRTIDGFEMQLGVNHLGHFALTALLLPMLLATPGARVATMSSMGHRAGRLNLDDLMFESRGYRRWSAYFQSKLANLLFTAELDRRLDAASASCVAVAAHPGGSHTDLGTEGTSVSNRLVGSVVPLVTQSAAAGALPMLRAATDLGVQGGEFYGPRWFTRGYPVQERPSAGARNEQSARELWNISLELTGIQSPV
jgi:protochlorophyllide reductase